MDSQRKIALKLGAGVITLLGAAIAMAGAHEAGELRQGRVIKEAADSNYQYTIRESPVKPDEAIRRDGTFPSGYYYTCAVLKNGLPVSSYTLYPPKTFRASQVKVERLTLVRRRGLMTAFEFDSNQTLGYDVICRWLEPNAVDPTPEFRWQAASEDGI